MGRSRARLNSLAPAVAVVALGALTSGARAATFEVIRSTPDTVTMVNRSAIEAAGDGAVRRVQVVTVQRSLSADGPPQPGYVNTLTEYDCGAWRSRWRSFSVYSRFGDLILHKDNPDPAWASMYGNVEAEAGGRVVCEGRENGEVYAAPSIGQLVIQLIQAWDPQGAAAPPPAAPKKKHR